MHDCVSGVWWQLSYQGSSEPSSAETSTWKVVSLVLWGHKLCFFGSSLHLPWVASDLCFFDPVVKVPIVNHLEFLRDEELEERREKRRKQLAEEETKITDKGKEDKENRDQNAQVILKGWGDSSLAVSICLNFLWFWHTHGTKIHWRILGCSHWNWEFAVHSHRFVGGEFKPRGEITSPMSCWENESEPKQLLTQQSHYVVTTFSDCNWAKRMTFTMTMLLMVQFHLSQ